VVITPGIDVRYSRVVPRFTHVADVARACELAADHELTGVYNVGTEEAYSFNETVDMIDDALGTDIDPVYVECRFDGYVHDTMADYSTFHDAIGWEPEIDFREGVERVCVPYREADAPRTN
jgi:UDP-glucose 4-epimerase